MPSGAAAVRTCRLVPRFAGAEEPKRITPPAPAATSAVTAATSLSSTGTTSVCSARRVRLHVASTAGVGARCQASRVGAARRRRGWRCRTGGGRGSAGERARSQKRSLPPRSPEAQVWSVACGLYGRGSRKGAGPAFRWRRRRSEQLMEREHEIRSGAPGRDCDPATRAGDPRRGLRLGRGVRLGGGVRRRRLEPAGGDGRADRPRRCSAPC